MPQQATLLFIGAILTIIGIGVILILVSWIFVIIGFSTMKPKDYQPYNAQTNGYGYTQPPTTANTATQTTKPKA